MPDTTVTDTSHPIAPSGPGLFARAIGIITAPTATYGHVVRTPKVAGMLLLVAVVIGLAQGVPQLTERGRAASLEMQVQQMTKFGVTVTDEMYQALERRSHSSLAVVSVLAGSFIGLPFMMVIMTSLLWAVFNTIMGGAATFKQVMAVVVHSQVISAAGALFAAPIMYARGVMTTGVANVGALLPMLDETSVLARFLGMIDLFLVWWVIVLSIGLAALYKRKVGPIATGLCIFYGVIAIGIAYFTAR